MKVSITYVDKDYKKNKELVEDFCSFLQKHFPLNSEFRIHFLPERVGGMTTGSRSDKNLLKVNYPQKLEPFFYNLKHPLLI